MPAGVDVVANVGRVVQVVDGRSQRWKPKKRASAHLDVRAHPVIEVVVEMRWVHRSFYPWVARTAGGQPAVVRVVDPQVDVRIEPVGGGQVNLPNTPSVRGGSKQA